MLDADLVGAKHLGQFVDEAFAKSVALGNEHHRSVKAPMQDFYPLVEGIRQWVLVVERLLEPQIESLDKRLLDLDRQNRSTWERREPRFQCFVLWRATQPAPVRT